ncbi:zinc finger protein 90 [Pieris rapae]|uniref:zinc finger protein 90 n=1 Tax=Pieris rapae TaxID=64459 RepID=UPI001E27CED4|nr:zinc finger protein 90 [Pieris rapae]
MLSPHDDDDDNHLCIKCNATIVGLENYVKHRKQRCGKLKNVEKSVLPIDPLEPSYSLGADVFFQSLELQSSVKKSSSLSRLTPPTPIYKTSSDRKHTHTNPSTSRDIPRMSPLENNLRGEDWIGGHSLKLETSEDNQLKLIKAVARISGAAKKDVSTPTYNINAYNDFKDDLDVSDDSEDEDEEETAHVEKWKPPPNYTGGKWRPASPDHDDWEPLNIDTHERDEDYDAPPPDHTKGKWVPGQDKTQIMQTTLQSKGSVQYWCGPCNRRLGSRAIYDKHLMSNLHMRKVLPEQELEFAGHLEPFKNVPEKRTTRSAFLNIELSPKKKQKLLETKNISKKKRKRKPVFVQCSGCKSRVKLYLMGKHLISHYHFRKATDTKSEDYKLLILNNMEAIVHQSPFQCSPCKFYTNWLSNFMQHWYSAEHQRNVESMNGRFWCSFCKFECEASQEMLDHLSSSEHTEVVAVINRSMPIIIRKKTVIKCETCSKEFRYNIEVKQHCDKTGHMVPPSASDMCQEFHKCQHCKKKFKSSITLCSHLKSEHKAQVFFCIVCSKVFDSSSEAKQHRQTSEHRVRTKEKLIARGLCSKDLRKKCPYCPGKVLLKNVLELRDHVRCVHPHITKKCSKCGKAFTLPQEVTRHIRSNSCQFLEPNSANTAGLWNCSQCLFTTDSQAECFFHEVLHTEPIFEDKETIKYSCPLCNKVFRKKSLREHLRQHTFERPFACTICGANFTRQSSLSNHVKTKHDNKEQNVPKIKKIMDLRCQKCKKKCNNEEELKSHTASCQVYQLQCTEDQCTFIASTPTQMFRHRKSHGIAKAHECLECNFKTDQISHLKRHLVTHKGLKPYACPHCTFTCASLENLRKHVLKGKKHPGMYLYRCKYCEYETNLANDLRTHYITIHSSVFNLKTAIEEVKNQLMLKNT